MALRWSFWIWLGREKEEWFAQRSRDGGGQATVGAVNETATVEFSEPTEVAESGMDTEVDAECPDAVSESIDFQVEVLRKEAGKTWSGIKNIGNSCYIGAVLQCLALVDGVVVTPPREEAQVPEIVLEYQLLVKKLQSREDKIVSPSRFKRALSKWDARFNNSEPQDAHELLDVVFYELSRRAPCCEAVEKRSLGKILSTMSCSSCKYVSAADEEEFRCLSLKLKDQSQQSLSECLEMFFMEEVIPLTQKWRCSKCEQVRTGCKQLTVVSCPSLLVIHLARFIFENGQVSKNQSQVGVPQVVHVATTNYKLVAVVKHRGSRHSGHYIAEVKSERGWLVCNDSEVERTVKQSIE